MPAGLFGKLPAKRDFVALNASRAFLEVWEPWLQASVATSRQTLGEAWIDAYNSAPIWRFWLGADFCGEAMLGALMASVDGVGRPFRSPSSRAKATRRLPPPEIEPNDAWCEAAEAVLLDALEPGAALEAIAAEVARAAPAGASAADNRGTRFRRAGRRRRPGARHRRRGFRRLRRGAALRPTASLCLPDLLVDDRRRGLSLACLSEVGFPPPCSSTC